MRVRFIAYKTVASLCLLLTAAYAQASQAVYSVLDGVSLSPRDMNNVSQPIGHLSGTWLGTWGDYQLELNHASEPTTLMMTYTATNEDEGLKRIVVTAEFTRKGRLITLGEITCLRQVDQRQWVLGRQGCPSLKAGDAFELVRGEAQQWMLRASNALIPLSRG